MFYNGKMLVTYSFLFGFVVAEVEEKKEIVDFVEHIYGMLMKLLGEQKNEHNNC